MKQVLLAFVGLQHICPFGIGLDASGHTRARVFIEFAVDECAQFVVCRDFGARCRHVSVETVPASRAVINFLKRALARLSRDITVPTGMPRTVAASA